MTSKLNNAAKSFTTSEDGTMTAFGLGMIFAMAIVGGIAFDLLKHENTRTHLQAIVDISTLAAANMDNSQDPETVVRDYFEKAGLTPYLETVDAPDNLILSKRVTAVADATVGTAFMRFAGVPELSVSTTGTAEQNAGDVEISMVLDVSGSMLGQKEINLRTAASNFVDTLFPLA